MLEKVDLSKKLKKKEYKSVITSLEMKLGDIQRKTRELGIPVIIAFEGWDAAGKGSLINRLLLAMDPRGFSVYSINEPKEEERFRPYLWRFWIKTPPKGRAAIFDQSWYSIVLSGRVEKTVKKKIWMDAYDEIKSFERQLTDDGTAIIKIFLHISQEEQQRRFEVLEANPATSWKVTQREWETHQRYGEYCRAIDDMIGKTDTDFAPWMIVEAHDWRFTTVKVFTTVIDALESKVLVKEKELQEKESKAKPTGEVAVSSTEPPKGKKAIDLKNMSSSILDRVDLSVSTTREDYEQQLKQCQVRLRELEHEAYKKRLPIILVFEGWDAAGKGGNIRRLVQGLDPRGYDVVPIAAPSDVEKAHHYLWRFWSAIPKAGHIAIFDRSWYGRVLVERVEGYCSQIEWKRAFREINEMEEHLVHFGSVLAKFWMQIDREEQLRRFEDRQENPFKNWKITAEDWRNREKWAPYKAAVDEMLFRTSTAAAPWTIVESNCKLHARIKVMKTVIEEVEKQM